VGGSAKQGADGSAGDRESVQLSPASQERLQRLQEDLGEGEPGWPGGSGLHCCSCFMARYC
jgi:hypothetical protein